jgi:hypothetical protein
LPSHGEVDGHSVALFDAKGFEDVRDLAYLDEEFAVGYLPAVTRFVCFVDDRGLREVNIGIADY